MELRKGEWAVLAFTALYVLAFGAFYVAIGNLEFLWYVAVLVFFGVLIASTLRKSGFGYLILWGLSLWGFLHMAGGGLRIGGDVLYNLKLVPLYVSENFYVLKFDQLVHAYGFFVAALVAWHLLKRNLVDDFNPLVVYPMVVAVSMGLGALNEIVEFAAVLAFPETNVGGYFNTGLDLVFNTVGAVLAAVFIHWREE